tara:strand:- start:753 stop:1985 length:1233 start_codon:yes stop_codon:yes gene_type:complete
MADPKYITDNTDGSTLTYNKRIIYNSTSEEDQDEYRNLVDFNLGEKFLYGRVNKRFIPIFSSAEKLRGMRSAASAHLDAAEVIAFDFVIDAFRDLQNQFDKQIQGGKINPNLDFLSSLKIYKSYVDPVDLFNEHQDTYTGQLIQHFNDKNIKVKNFSEFLKQFADMITKTAPSHPFTFSSFVKSKYCPINASGLVIEIADEKYFDDSKKIDHFINTENWRFFLNACRSYGFSVDKNIPWRIVADIGSTEMLQYSRRYGNTNTQSILNLYYDRADVTYFNNFRQYLHKLYKSVILKEITVLEDCNGRISRKIIHPASYSEDYLKEIFDDKKLLKLYFDIRFLEEERVFKNSEKSRIYRDCLAIYRLNGADAALYAFESVVNHPFDYHGSLSYLLDRTKKGYGDRIVFSDIR